MDLSILFKGQQYLWMIIFIMITAGIAKERSLFSSMFAYLQATFKSNRAVVGLISAVGGVLPIEGRVTVSAGVLDTLCKDHNHGRKKLGVIDYLSTHHYYLWSPMEKTVILPLAVFGITYTSWLTMIWPLMAVTAAYILYYIFVVTKEQDISISHEGEFKISAVLRNVVPFFLAIGYYIYQGGQGNVFTIFGLLALYYCLITQTWHWRKLISYINWSVVVTVAVAIALGNYFKSQEAFYKSLLNSSILDPHTAIGLLLLTLLVLVVSFLMGSSGKYVAFAVLVSQIAGYEYFVWFFTVCYVGYLMSPTHKCVPVGNRYFNTPIKDYYKAIGIWSALMLIVASFTLVF